MHDWGGNDCIRLEIFFGSADEAVHVCTFSAYTYNPYIVAGKAIHVVFSFSFREVSESITIARHVG